MKKNASTAEREVDVISVHCNENPIYVFLDWELRGLSPNFNIHASVSDLYIPRISPHISWYFDGGNIIGTVAAQFLSGHICFKFSVLVLCSVGGIILTYCNLLKQKQFTIE
jgi:hypothetical protein